MTNYKRLRNMTVAELADWLSRCMDCNLCPVSFQMCKANLICRQAWIDYLVDEEF